METFEIIKVPLYNRDSILG